MTFLQKTVFISFILLLSGCSAFRSQETTTNIVNPNQWKEHKQKVSQLDTWQIKGKAAIRTEKESGSGTFFWLQKKEYFDIRLSGPLGRGSVRLAGRPGNIVLDEANKGSYTAASPEEL
ncbi:UNVERIFIED_CONTAM: hypothetical protein GTU68_001249, partial [Idotea baltica]|nr:hypothetical protein [Idotea baltica]